MRSLSLICPHARLGRRPCNRKGRGAGQVGRPSLCRVVSAAARHLSTPSGPGSRDRPSGAGRHKQLKGIDFAKAVPTRQRPDGLALPPDLIDGSHPGHGRRHLRQLVLAETVGQRIEGGLESLRSFFRRQAFFWSFMDDLASLVLVSKRPSGWTNTHLPRPSEHR